MSISGRSWGKIAINKGNLVFNVDGKLAMDLPLRDVSQAQVWADKWVGNNVHASAMNRLGTVSCVVHPRHRIVCVHPHRHPPVGHPTLTHPCAGFRAGGQG
jgi:hypothetical protein